METNAGDPALPTLKSIAQEALNINTGGANPNDVNVQQQLDISISTGKIARLQTPFHRFQNTVLYRSLQQQ